MKKIIFILLFIPQLLFAQEVITELIKTDKEGKTVQNEESLAVLNEELRKLKNDIAVITEYKTGSFTRDTSLASGTQAVTGVGFQPKAVIFFMSEAGAATEFSIGLDDGTNTFVIYQSTAVEWQLSSSDSIFDHHGVTPTRQYQGEILSFDTDGFTITWTKTDSPTGTITIGYLAFK